LCSAQLISNFRPQIEREGADAIASFFIDKAAEGMAILEHGAAYKGQQDHQLGN